MFKRREMYFQGNAKSMSEVVECRTPEIAIQVSDPLLRLFLRLTARAIEAKIPESYINEAQLN